MRFAGFAFLSSFASNGYHATTAWLRAVHGHVTQNLETRLRRIAVFFSTLPLIADFDEETREVSAELPEDHVQVVEGIAASFYRDLVMGSRMYLHINFKSIFSACVAKEDLTPALKARALALDFATAPAKCVENMFVRGLERLESQGWSPTTADSFFEVFPGSDEEKFVESLRFCDAAQQLYWQFFDQDRMKKSNLAVRDGVQVEVIDYVDMVLRSWFSCWGHRDAADAPFSWREFAEALLAQVRCESAAQCTQAQRERVLQELCPILALALDKAVSSFVRQYAVLDYSLRTRYPEQHRTSGGIFHWIEARLPVEAVQQGMDITAAQLLRYRSRFS
mmetsp:Transcript_105197/g.241106  ORF Transcript_105197/g.241106 Transcript_105197/m.241106 type:complete len:336 (+) Transcript_105197:1590-2597(+)